MAAGAGDAGLRLPLPDPDTDLISALPDELVQAILARLPSTAAAARTSVLSRRWRRVWTLSFLVAEKRRLDAHSYTADAVDAALDAYSASATLSRVTIDVHDPYASPPASRVEPWLRFASLRLSGELRLSLEGGAFQQTFLMDNRIQQLELPAFERATRIDLAGINCTLCLPPAGAFAALRVLSINVATLVRGDVGRLVSVQCPRLRDLEMCDVNIENGSLSMSAASLERLVLRRVSIGKEERIDVAAPKLHYLALDNCGGRSAAATIATPMLGELIWNHAYDPSRHNITGADRQIYRLVVTLWSNADLLKRFDAVDELCRRLCLPSKAEEYRKFLQDMNELPKAKVLEVKRLSTKRHLEPTMLHLLRKHSRLTKIKVDLIPANLKETECPHGCSCVPPESCTADDVVLDWLEEVEISSFTGAPEDFELLKLLFRCKIKIRRLAIHTTRAISLSQETQKRIWGLARPRCINLEFEAMQFSR